MSESKRANLRDAFPSTASTWLGERLEAGEAGLAEARRHVMSVYARPLRVYLLGSSFRSLGEPDELVDEFFAEALSNERFLQSWSLSGAPLRRWLMASFKNHLRNEARHRRRRRFGLRRLVQRRELSPPEPEAMFEREVGLAILRDALRRAEQSCAQAGLETHWRLFLRRRVDGLSSARIAIEFGVTERRALVMERTARAKLRSALRESAAWEGASPREIDRELETLAERVQP